MKTLASLALLLAAACHPGPTDPRTPRSASPEPGAAIPTIELPEVAAEDACPMAVAGAIVTVEETATGAAMVFTTTGDLEMLRGKVVAMADLHNREHQKMGPLPDGIDDTSVAAESPESSDIIWGDEEDPTFASGGYGTSPPKHDQGVADTALADEDPLILTHSRAEIEPFAGGVRLVFIADPDNVDALRDEVALQADHFAQGRCD